MHEHIGISPKSKNNKQQQQRHHQHFQLMIIQITYMNCAKEFGLDANEYTSCMYTRRSTTTTEQTNTRNDIAMIIEMPFFPFRYMVNGPERDAHMQIINTYACTWYCWNRCSFFLIIRLADGVNRHYHERDDHMVSVQCENSFTNSHIWATCWYHIYVESFFFQKKYLEVAATNGRCDFFSSNLSLIGDRGLWWYWQILRAKYRGVSLCFSFVRLFIAFSRLPFPTKCDTKIFEEFWERKGKINRIFISFWHMHAFLHQEYLFASGKKNHNIDIYMCRGTWLCILQYKQLFHTYVYTT